MLRLKKTTTPIFSALSNRNFAIYMLGNAISQTGMWIQRLALPWLAWQLTKSGVWLGAIAFVQLIPVVFIGPFAGVLADRIDRRMFSIWVQVLFLLQAVLLWGVTLTGNITIEFIAALSLFQGIISAFSFPFWLALIPSLARPKDLPSAVALGSVVFNMARFIGPAIAGPVIAYWGVAAAFGVNAMTYLVMIAGLVALRLPQQQYRATAQSVIGDIMDGVRYVMGRPPIYALMAFWMLGASFGRPALELLPGFVDVVFQRGSIGFAIMTSATGVGAIVSGLWLAHRGVAPGLENVAFLSALASGISVALFALTPFFWPAVILVTIAGGVVSSCAIASQTYIQYHVSDTMRGRVMSLWGMISFGGTALGALAVGGLTKTMGLAPPVVIAGGLCAILALVAFRRWIVPGVFKNAEVTMGATDRKGIRESS